MANIDDMQYLTRYIMVAASEVMLRDGVVYIYVKKC